MKDVFMDKLIHDIIQSTVSFNSLTAKRQSEISHNMTFIHGIAWSDANSNLKVTRRKILVKETIF